MSEAYNLGNVKKQNNTGGLDQKFNILAN